MKQNNMDSSSKLKNLQKNIEQDRLKRDAIIAGFISKAGDAGAIIFRHTKDATRYVFVSHSLISGGWRATNFDSHGPDGHHEFPTRIAAIKAVAGDRFSDDVPGPAYYRTGDYVFERIRSPDSSGRKVEFKRLSMVVDLVASGR